MESNKKTPRVSVRLPSYNHEKYIRECVESVLAQTFADFEFVITDDGSTDRTAEIIREYKDSRIRLNVFKSNSGCALAVEDALIRVRGEYVANICSDDAWELDKLQKQVEFLDAHPEFDAVFTGVLLVGEDGSPLQNHPLNTVFTMENRSMDEWLRHFFYFGNALCIPSVMIRREVYKSLSYQDKRMANLLDFDLWVRFAMEHRLYILEEKLTRFRVRAGEANASGDRVENRIRNRFEFKQIMNHFLRINSVERLLSVFPECIRYGNPEDSLVPYFLGRLALDTGEDFKQLWGMETIFNFMQDNSCAQKLEKTCGFTFRDFHGMSKNADVFKVQEGIDFAVAKKEIERLCILADARENRIKEMKESSSWKLTAPLRKAVDALKKRLKKEGQKNDRRNDQS